MSVDEIDWGSEDARNLRLHTPYEVDIFLGSYILPGKFRLDDFLDGYRFFVFGAKGTGKTALLQYIRLMAEAKRNAVSTFFYFQSSFSSNDLKAFLKDKAKANDRVIDDSNLEDADEATLFWRMLLLTEVAALFKRINAIEGVAGEFLKAVEAARLISKSQNVNKKYPSLQKFAIEVSKDPKFQLEGVFEKATIGDLSAYLDIAEDRLKSTYFGNAPLYLFIDEMEVFLKGDEGDALRLAAVAALVRAVRDFNEKFRDNDVRVIAAIRDAVVDQVSTVQGEISRIIRDNGVAVDWPVSVRGGYHPLERMILARVVLQDQRFADLREHNFDKALAHAERLYFPKAGALRNCLNLTWYRPRDVSMLFDEASNLDRGNPSFLLKTLTDGVVRPLGRRLWDDAVSGLAVKYVKKELDGIDQLLRGGLPLYDKASLLGRIDSLGHDYNNVALLGEARLWVSIVEDLYRAGAMYTLAKDSGKKNFAFRGDPIPSLTDDFKIGVHQVLLKHLSIRS